MAQHETKALPAPRNDHTAQNAIERQGIDGATLERQSTSAMVLAEKARAMVQARIMQAVARPRDLMVVRQRILDACHRPGFAAVGLYQKKVGKKKNEATGRWEDAYAIGPSIRFAEEALRTMGNLSCEQTVVYEDARVRTIRIEAIDLETNASTSKEITIEKTVERREPKAGQNVIGRRINSYGDPVYIVEASEDEFAVKAAAHVAKARRDVILQLVPGDIVEEARWAIEETIEAGDKAKDPAARRKELVDWFRRELGLTAANLAEYLGHNLDTATSEEMKELRLVGNAVAQKEMTWAQALEAKRAPVEDVEAPAAGQQAAESGKRTTAGANVAEKLRAGRGGAKAGEVPATATQQPSAPAQKPAVDPGAGFAEASAIVENAEACADEDELAPLREQLEAAAAAGRIGTTHATRARNALEKAQARIRGQ